MLSFFFLYPHLYPRFVFATPPGTHDAARMRWGGNPEELNPCSSPQHRLQPAWGPLHLTPLGDVRNSPRVRLELPALQPSRENLRRGGALPSVSKRHGPSNPATRAAAPAWPGAGQQHSGRTMGAAPGRCGSVGCPNMAKVGGRFCLSWCKGVKNGQVQRGESSCPAPSGRARRYTSRAKISGLMW